MAAFIGHRCLHVYCYNPMRLTMMPTGREGWKRYPEKARYMVVCPAAGLDRNDLDVEDWVTSEEAASMVVAAIPLAEAASSAA